MFYIPNLLIRQKGGKFCFAWIAATRGIQHVQKDDILSANIVQLCADIMIMIQTSSSKTTSRLSLSLSSRLINGTIKIHRRQVEIVLEEIYEFLSRRVTRPRAISELNSIDQGTQETPKVKKRLPKRKRPVPVSQEVLIENIDLASFLLDDVIIPDDVFNRPAVNQVNPTLITIRESLVTRSRSRYDENVLGELGVLLEFDTVQDNPPSVLPLDCITIDLQDEENPVVKRRRTVPEIELEEPSATTVGETDNQNRNLIQVVVDVHRAQNGDSPSSQTGDIPLAQTDDIPPAQRQVEHEPEVVSELPIQQEVAPPVEKKTRKLDKVHIKIRPTRRFVKIDREDYNINNIFPSIPEIHPALKKLIPCKDVDITSLVSEFLEGPQQIHKLLATFQRGSMQASSNLSRSVQRRSVGSKNRRELTPLNQILEDTNQIVVPVEGDNIPPATEIVQENIVESENLPVQEPIAKGASVCSPLRPSIPVHLTPPHTTEICAPAVAQRNGNIPRHRLPLSDDANSPPRNVLRKDRQKRIKHIIKNWTGEDITIEDLCVKPIKRYDIAATFFDLLSMHKMGYVKLNNKPDSVELGTIEKGPKLLH